LLGDGTTFGGGAGHALGTEGLVAARKGSGWYVVSGASFGQTLALGSFQHARAAVSRSDAEDPGVWESLRRKGHEIEVVRQTIAAAAASATVAELLDTAPGVPLLLIRRLALLPDGRPLALSDHRYLGHRFRLEVEFRGGPTTDPPGVMEVS
jgi:DNA-binding GntR family transcriptional regulator